MQIWKNDNATLYCGDCMSVLQTLPERFDFIVADPPYSSGGMFRSDRMQDTNTKYSGRHYVSFLGDNRDQRSLMLWNTLWMQQCLDISAPSALFFCFIDWRNLPCTVDAMQAAGWIYHGIIPWDKKNARPVKGMFRAQCEYIAWGSNGPLRHEGFGAGFISMSPPSGNIRIHPTQKPEGLFEELFSINSAGSYILDPFMGSGTAGVAAIRTGRRFVGIEKNEHYFEAACQRIEDTCKEARYPKQIAFVDMASTQRNAPEGTGKILKGNIGQEDTPQSAQPPQPLPSTQPDTQRFTQLLQSNGNDHVKAAHEYFREKLQGRYVEGKIKVRTETGETERTEIIQATFTGNGMRELKRGLQHDPVKASLIPFMPDIISTGDYIPNALYKARRDNTTVFHTFNKKIKLDGEEYDVLVDVAERPKMQPQHVVYNLTREGSSGYNTRKEHQVKSDGVTSMSLGFLAGDKSPALSGIPGPITRDNAITDEDVSPFFEVVNIRFTGEEI